MSAGGGSSSPADESAEPVRGAAEGRPQAGAGSAANGEGTPARRSPSLWALSLGALGVVYGDIGTSPLYAVRECFAPGSGLAVTPANVLGVLSLIFWSLVIGICVKYMCFVMRADNRGEGGILALLSLTRAGRADRFSSRGRFTLLLLGLFGAALLYGDGMITPAISVLSAVEGLEVATHAFEPYILPITIAILLGLFAVQSRGTARVAAVFGPTMLLWFGVLAFLGGAELFRQRPDHVNVLAAIDPFYGAHFLWANGHTGFLVLGIVVLVITGGEALYADLGHFGAPPIRLGWFAVVFPSLLLNYFGQGALLLDRGAPVGNPFFQLAPSWALYPLVALATAATIIASQALISGSFSLTQQAVQLGYVPRFTVIHTSGEASGQIFIPQVNRLLMVLCILLVLGFRSSGALAHAYGMAVTGTMTITSLLFYAVARERWGWSRLRAGLLVAGFLVFDLAFLSANLVKFFQGAWFPLAVGAAIFAVMTTWKRGRAELARLLESERLPMPLFLNDLEATRPTRVPGVAVVMTSDREGVPTVLLHHLKHNKVLHERVLLLSFVMEPVPEIEDEERLEMSELGQGFYRAVVRWGFMERPRMEHVLELLRRAGFPLELESTTFFLGRETLLPTGRVPMARWRKHLFALLSRNAPSVSAYFGIPPNRVIEIGAQLEL